MKYQWKAKSFFGNTYELLDGTRPVLSVNVKNPEAAELSAPGIDLVTQCDIGTFETGGAFVIKATNRASGDVISSLFFERPSWGTRFKKDHSPGRIETQSGITYTLQQEDRALAARSDGHFVTVTPGPAERPKETTTDLNVKEGETSAILLCLFALPFVIRYMHSG